jgi:hypothetical protein
MTLVDGRLGAERSRFLRLRTLWTLNRPIFYSYRAIEISFVKIEGHCVHSVQTRTNPHLFAAQTVPDGARERPFAFPEFQSLRGLAPTGCTIPLAIVPITSAGDASPLGTRAGISVSTHE